jgi:hypothetical protein
MLTTDWEHLEDLLKTSKILKFSAHKVCCYREIEKLLLSYLGYFRVHVDCKKSTKAFSMKIV